MRVVARAVVTAVLALALVFSVRPLRRIRKGGGHFGPRFLNLLCHEVAAVAEIIKPRRPSIHVSERIRFCKGEKGLHDRL